MNISKGFIVTALAAVVTIPQTGCSAYEQVHLVNGVIVSEEEAKNGYTAPHYMEDAHKPIGRLIPPIPHWKPKAPIEIPNIRKQQESETPGETYTYITNKAND